MYSFAHYIVSNTRRCGTVSLMDFYYDQKKKSIRATVAQLQTLDYYRSWTPYPLLVLCVCILSGLHLCISFLCFLLYIYTVSFVKWQNVEWVSDCCLTPNEQFSSNIIARTSHIRWDNNDARFVLACFVLDQHALY